MEPKRLRFSASRLKLWMECSLAAHFRYDIRPPAEQNAAASWGTIIHHCLQLYNTGTPVEKCLKLFKDLWRYPERLSVEPGYWPPNTSWSNYEGMGIAIIKEFDRLQRYDQREVLGVEVPFAVPFGRYELTGFVDCLELRKTAKGKLILKIIDYKTAGRQPTKFQLGLDVQFTTYDYAVQRPEFWLGNGTPEFPGVENGAWIWERVKGVPRRCIWYQLRSQREIDAGSRSQVHYDQLYRVCTEIEKAMEHEVYVPHIGEACGVCDYKAYCPLDVPEDLPSEDEVRINDPNAWI